MKKYSGRESSLKSRFYFVPGECSGYLGSVDVNSYLNAAHISIMQLTLVLGMKKNIL